MQISEILQNATNAAVTSRAGTAAGDRVPHMPSMPSPAAPPPQSRLAAHHNHPNRNIVQTASVASTASFRIAAQMSGNAVAVVHVPEDSLEALTAQALDSLPVESEALDLNARVASEFQKAKNRVEDWIETQVQCNYKVRKSEVVYFVCF